MCPAPRVCVKGIALAVLLVFAPAAGAYVWAADATLPYRAQNHWVAPSSNATLQPIYQAAKNGTTHFNVVLPNANRTLSEHRLGVLMGLIEKHAQRPITLREVSGTTAPNTLKVVW